MVPWRPLAAATALATLAIQGWPVAPYRALAAVITVNSGGQRSSQTSDLCTLGAAILAANTDAAVDGCPAGSGPDTIVALNGFFQLLVPDPAGGSPPRPFGLPSITSDITIEGGDGAAITRFAGTGIPDFGLLEILPTGRLVLKAVTLNGGRALEGGAVVNQGRLEMVGGIVEHNQALGGNGGGILGPVHLRGTIVRSNQASGAGGGIFGSTNASESIFLGNVAGGNGGAIACEEDGCLVALTTSSLLGNQAARGGAIAARGLSVNRSVFQTNIAALDGGAIHTAGATIRDSLFATNRARDGAAVSGASLTITGSTFHSNTAEGEGGALRITSGPSTLVNSTVSDNLAAVGAGIAAGEGLSLRNATVSGNQASERAGGLRMGAGVLRNSLIAGNSAPIGPDCVTQDATLASDGGNVIGDGTDCAIAPQNDQIGTATTPLPAGLDVLRDNGGPDAGDDTQPMPIPTRALLVESPALDTGNPATPGSGGTACEATDQRGAARPEPPGGRCDAGAFEGQAPVQLAINDVTVVEGDAGPRQAIFTVSLTTASEDVVSVEFQTVDGTAGGEIDYRLTSGILTFAPGQTTLVQVVEVIGDTLDEADETFFVDLVNPVGAVLGRPRGTATILDDDPLPTLSISDVSVTEGIAGGVAPFTVTLSAPSGRPVSVGFTTVDQTATAGEDYTAASGTLTFAAGETSKTIAVAILSDSGAEPAETFAVDLRDPVNAGLGEARGTGTITDTPPAFTLSIADASVQEGNTGSRNVSFTVTLSRLTTFPVTVRYDTADGTAEAGSDYVAASGVLSFEAGQTSRTITIVVNGDTTAEPDETFFVDLSAPTTFVVIARGRATGTIRNDDGSGPPVPITVAERLTLVDAPGVVPPRAISVAESLALVDVPAAVPPAVVTLSETLPLLIDQPAAVPPAAVTVAEGLTLVDQPGAVPPASIAMAETLTLADAPGAVPPATIAVAEALTLADQPGAVPPASIAVTEPLQLTDQPGAIPPTAIDVAETLTLADEPGAVPPAAIAVTEALTLADHPGAVPPATATRGNDSSGGSR
jgi:predicted outer membrane repeat protein